MILIKRDREYMITGINAVLMEMCYREVNRGGNKINHKWFRRCCRRHGVGSIDCREQLIENGIITSREYPLVMTRNIMFLTFEEWKIRGYHVGRGETSEYRNMDYKAVFHSFQIYRGS